ncbi:MAG: fatty acid desaturase [Planctomycetes bacterium]|nr:fatty acid desaturase [Planctomycetota bacterium]
MCGHSTSSQTPASTRADAARLHEFDHWPARWIWPLLAAMVALQAAAVSLSTAYWPLLLVIWPALGSVMFVFVLAFHDASHGRMHPVHWLNEAFGHTVGTLGFTPLHAYRFAHARHHAHLARSSDPELWPFNSPGISRPVRIAAALAEIVLGYIYTPLLFLRSVVVGPLSPRERALIVRGYVACALVWTAVLAASYVFNLWIPLLVGTIVPMAISGMLQTLNKFEQHLGLHGETVLGLTRTVVDRHRYSKLVSSAMLYNDYHGTHHRYARIPYYHLPNATPFALAGAREHCPVYPSIASAILDMLSCLRDPKVGPQWIVRRTESAAEPSPPVSAATNCPTSFHRRLSATVGSPVVP